MVTRRWLPIALGLALAASACSSQPTVRVPVSAGSTTVSTGDTLEVDFGEVNSSIGDGWFVMSPPDPEILVDRGSHLTSRCDQPGCGSQLTWRFTATKAGSTTVTFRYCYRTQLAECDPGPGRGPSVPVSLSISVT